MIIFKIYMKESKANLIFGDKVSNRGKLRKHNKVPIIGI